MIQENKPLLSYLLLTYNQEKYIHEAIESAFAQTYSPLEIIISDDHSTDNTWVIIKKLFVKYNGQHKIIINRNKTNLGIARHVNKVMSMANGELLVMAAGDDFSIPERTATLYKYWTHNKNIKALTSRFVAIDSDGNISKSYPQFMNEFIKETDLFSKNMFFGGGAAYSSELRTKFGPIQTPKSYEDLIYYRRALLQGTVCFLKEKLVFYRLVGITNSQKRYQSFENVIDRQKQKFANQFAISKQYLYDYNISEKENYNYKIKVEKYNQLCFLRNSFYNEKMILKKLIILMRLIIYTNKPLGFYQHEMLHFSELLIMILSIFPYKFSNIIYNFYKK